MVKPVVKVKRGAPGNTQLDYVRAAWWVRSVQLVARKTLGALEREIDPHAVYRREDGYTQNGNWKKYATGRTTPTPPRAGEKSPVVRAEKHYPGTQAAYEAVIWGVIANYDPDLAEVIDALKRVSPVVLRQLKKGDLEGPDLRLSPRGMLKVAKIRHLDALALMLLQWRSGRRYMNELDVYCLRVWLMHASRWIFQFRMNRTKFLDLLTNEVPEIGLLALPEYLAFGLSDEVINRICHVTFITAGKPARMVCDGKNGPVFITANPC